MSLTDKVINEIIGEVDVDTPIKSEERHGRAAMHALNTQVTKLFDTPEDYLAFMGEALAPFRERLGGTDVDDELTLAYEAADRRKQQNSN